jgi:hypothetical protein
MKDKLIIIFGTFFTIIINILMIFFVIEMFKTNIICAIIATAFCFIIGYFDGRLIRYFIYKIKERNERKN